MTAAVAVPEVPACFAYFFSRLHGCTPCRGKKYAFKAKCPAHDDKIQSLSVRVGAKGQLYVRCHAGGLCKLETILSRMECTMDDLFPDNKRFKKSERESIMSRPPIVYQYRDPNNKLLFEALRKEPKGFMQRRPNPDFVPTLPADKDNPEYVYNMEGVVRVLYRLPELLAALAKTPDKTILVVEGEKDVETARAVGIVATTNPMGAGKWLPEFALHLKGANVVVIPDNDEPGKAHAKAVCESLKGYARTVRYFELPGVPDKGDFSDWWEMEGGTPDAKKQKLAKLMGALPLYGTAEKVVPVVNPAGTTAVKADPPKPEPNGIAPNEADDLLKSQLPPEPGEAGKHAAGEKIEFPNSPTVRNAHGLPNPDPAILPQSNPAPEPVPIEVPPGEAPKPGPRCGPVPGDRAARVAGFIKDAKATAAALKAAGATVGTPMEFYGAIHLAVAELDKVYTLSNGVPHLDKASISQVALLMGAYLFQAAADFGLGVGLIEDAKEPAK